MKIYLLLFVLVTITCVIAEDYTTKYDDMDIDRILQNGRILTNYIKCMLDEGPCTNEGRELKSKYQYNFYLFKLSTNCLNKIFHFSFFQ